MIFLGCQLVKLFSCLTFIPYFLFYGSPPGFLGVASLSSAVGSPLLGDCGQGCWWHSQQAACDPSPSSFLELLVLLCSSLLEIMSGQKQGEISLTSILMSLVLSELTLRSKRTAVVANACVFACMSLCRCGSRALSYNPFRLSLVVAISVDIPRQSHLI